MIKGKNIDKELFVAYNKTVFDLSGAAATEMAFLHPTKEATINNVYVLWGETGSADAGVALKIGSTDGGAEYFTATSTISKTAKDLQTYGTGTLTLGTIPAKTPVYIGHAGSKSGAGTCFVIFSYTLR